MSSLVTHDALRVTRDIVASSEAASAPVFTRSPGSVVAAPGSDLELDYAVSGWPEPRLAWRRDTGSLRNNESCRIGQAVSPQ